MIKFFIVEFEYDNGCQFITDTSLVKANNPEEAVEKLRKFINTINIETVLTEIFNVEEYKGDIFTRRSGILL